MDTMEFTAALNGLKMKVTGNSKKELHDRWMGLVRDAKPPLPVNADYWMQRIDTYSVKYTQTQLMRKPTIKIGEAWSAGMAILKQAQGDTVDQAEYDRRSKICAQCPMQTGIAVCMACGGAGKLSRLLGGIKKHIGQYIKIDERTKKSYCRVCGCSIPLLALTKTKYLPHEEAMQNFSRPVHCWMNKSSLNYKP